jgi:hypothetical protein
MASDHCDNPHCDLTEPHEHVPPKAQARIATLEAALREVESEGIDADTGARFVTADEMASHHDAATLAKVVVSLAKLARRALAAREGET